MIVNYIMCSLEGSFASEGSGKGISKVGWPKCTKTIIGEDKPFIGLELMLIMTFQLGIYVKSPCEINFDHWPSTYSLFHLPHLTYDFKSLPIPSSLFFLSNLTRTLIHIYLRSQIIWFCEWCISVLLLSWLLGLWHPASHHISLTSAYRLLLTLSLVMSFPIELVYPGNPG